MMNADQYFIMLLFFTENDIF